MKKKVVSIMMTAALAAGMLAGCGSKEAAPAETQAAAETKAEAAGETAAEEAAPAAEKYDETKAPKA